MSNRSDRLRFPCSLFTFSFSGFSTSGGAVEGTKEVDMTSPNPSKGYTLALFTIFPTTSDPQPRLAGLCTT